MVPTAGTHQRCFWLPLTSVIVGHMTLSIYPLTLRQVQCFLSADGESNFVFLFPLNMFCFLSIFLQNKCNVGYAFINMTDPSLIIPFYQVSYIIILIGKFSSFPSLASCKLGAELTSNVHVAGIQWKEMGEI